MSDKGTVSPDRIQVIVNGKDRGSDLDILSYDHEWEYAVFGEHGIPEDLRYGSWNPLVKCFGLPSSSPRITYNYYRPLGVQTHLDWAQRGSTPLPCAKHTVFRGCRAFSRGKLQVSGYRLCGLRCITTVRGDRPI